MSKREYQIPYPVDRALDSIADQPGIRPVRVHRIAFPLHVAEVSATVAAREPFDLLDRYMGLAIAACEFRSVAQISGYLGITTDVVDRVLRFLAEIGHVTGADGALTLTELGPRADAVTALAARPDRADYNLPDEHEDLRLVDVGEAFLPCYLIRAIGSSGYQSLCSRRPTPPPATRTWRRSSGLGPPSTRPCSPRTTPKPGCAQSYPNG